MLLETDFVFEVVNVVLAELELEIEGDDESDREIDCPEGDAEAVRV